MDTKTYNAITNLLHSKAYSLNELVDILGMGREEVMVALLYCSYATTHARPIVVETTGETRYMMLHLDWVKALAGVK